MERNEEIPISIFKDIHIHFPGDVYLLAFLVAMSDRAKSTPTRKIYTTLTGFVGKLESTYDFRYSKSLNSYGVMSVFRQNGIKGNPRLVLEEKDEQLSTVLLGK